MSELVLFVSFNGQLLKQLNKLHPNTKTEMTSGYGLLTFYANF